jgi:hypothetical protein
LRPAMSMPGLTSGQAAFGGVAPTPGQPLNNLPISAPATPYALPEDFVLQTGAYNTRDSFPSAFTPFTSSPSTVAGNTAAGPAGADQPTYAQLLDNIQRLSAQVQPLINRGQVDYGGGEVGFSQEESGRGFFGDMAAAANAMGFGPDPSNDPSNDPSPGFTGSVGPAGGAPSGDGPGDDDGTGSPAGDFEVGGLIRMAEGGELPTPPKMTELSVEDLGSTFDINDYIEKGILVGGMSKPIRDEYGKIIGYESGDLQGVSPEMPLLPLPIQRDVVFGRELRDKEAAMQITDAEREQMMGEMALRRGRTGISPTTGGLAGIQIGDPIKRNRPQYYSTVEDFRPRYAEGGIASVAQNLADKGRKGDSMLVHMTPDEVAGLQALAQQMGGSLTINPQTGLPEANLFKKLLPMVLGFALGPAGAGFFQSALTAGLAVGAGYTLATGSLQQGLAAGLGAYGGSNLGTGLQAAGTAGADVAVGNAAANEAAKTAATGVGEFAGGVNAAQVTGPTVSGGPSLYADITKMPLNITSNLGGTGSVANVASAPVIPTDPFGGPFKPIGDIAASSIPAPTAPITPGSALTGLERSLLGDKATRDLAAERYAAETGSTLGTSAMQTLGGISLQSAADEQEAIKAQQAAIDEKRERRKRLFEEIAERTLGRVNVRSGGLMQLAGGGMSYMEAGGTTGPTGAPRDVTGTGDGMSDSVPASIEGVQEARLADGEFVIPADVVADIGNGSSDAGSKKLYDMMDRIRKARHGTTEQPPEIQAERLMPA